MSCKEKPPLGLTPKFVIDERRVQTIERAVSDYMRHRIKVPVKWIEEYNERILSINKDVEECRRDCNATI